MILMTIPVGASTAVAETASTPNLLTQTRLGNNTEDITFVSNGPLASTIAILDGFDVLGLPAEGRGESHVRKLFDLNGIGIRAFPRGIAYVDHEKLFAINDAGDPSALFMVDHQGRLVEKRTIRFPDGYVPFPGAETDGMELLPDTAPVFAGHLLVASTEFDTSCPFPAASRVLVMRTDGQVVSVIRPSDPVGCGSFLFGVAFQAPDRLLLGVNALNEIWSMDFAGNILADPLSITEAVDIEALAQTRSGSIVAADYFAGRLISFDGKLNRTPENDRSYRIGIGVSQPRGIAWDPDTRHYLVAGFLAPISGSEAPHEAVVAVPETLDAVARAFDSGLILGLAYLPAEHRIAATPVFGPRALLIFDADGTLAEQVSVAPLRPFAVTYIPPRQEFVVGRRGCNGTLSVLSRTGAFLRTLDLRPAGVTCAAAIAFFNPDHPSGGQFLITDLDGNLIREFSLDGLGLFSLGDMNVITTGPNAGAFTVVDRSTSTLVVFRLD